MNICEMCGEDIDSSICPFCGTENTFSHSGKKKKNKISSVNIKEDLPTVEVALSRVRENISKCSTKALKIIHGYGSSGRGGVIKEELHYLLSKMAARSEISGWIPGEEFSGDYPETVSY